MENTGDVIPFSANDNGGDLVETSFLVVQGLITVRQYLNAGSPTESQLIPRINTLYQGRRMGLVSAKTDRM
jgi:hypothetical protein